MNNETNPDVAYKNFMKIFSQLMKLPSVKLKKKTTKKNKTFSESVVNRTDEKNLKKKQNLAEKFLQ